MQCRLPKGGAGAPVPKKERDRLPAALAITFMVLEILDVHCGEDNGANQRRPRVAAMSDAVGGADGQPKRSQVEKTI